MTPADAEAIVRMVNREDRFPGVTAQRVCRQLRDKGLLDREGARIARRGKGWVVVARGGHSHILTTLGYKVRGALPTESEALTTGGSKLKKSPWRSLIAGEAKKKDETNTIVSSS
jgi:hypothetical protein